MRRNVETAMAVGLAAAAFTAGCEGESNNSGLTAAQEQELQDFRKECGPDSPGIREESEILEEYGGSKKRFYKEAEPGAGNLLPSDYCQLKKKNLPVDAE